MLPGSLARVQAVMPPLAQAPLLAIRKRPMRIFSLDDYVADGIATPAQIEVLRQAIEAQRNIVVAGGTGSGKTTLLNALLAEPSFQQGSRRHSRRHRRTSMSKPEQRSSS